MEALTFFTALIEPRQPLKMKLVSTEDTSKVVYLTTLGMVPPKGILPVIKQEETSIIVIWADKLSLTISHTELDNGHRYDVKWEAIDKTVTSISDVIMMEDSHWYGGCQIHKQTWPIEQWNQKMSPYVAGNSFEGEWGGVMERYWLSSSGVAVVADTDIPLSVGMSKKLLTLQSKWVAPYNNVESSTLTLRYVIIQAANIKEAHAIVAETFFSKPEDIPDELMFKYPIWSTWAKYKQDIDQEIVLEFGKEIKDHDFPSCQIDIDDDWTKAYGDMTFDPKKFPDPSEMVKQLGEMGHRVTLWVHPFASPMSKAVKLTDYWVGSSLPTNNVSWWNGVAKTLDVTDEDACTWFRRSLQELVEKHGVTSFKFDAGEVSWLPSKFITKKTMVNPSDYTTKYAQLAYDIDREVRCQEVRVGFRTQNLPVFVRMMDKDSTWDSDNGLKTLIPHALTFSLLGYPFILPDMIGGNAYFNILGINMPNFISSAIGSLPDRELYIRWMQANVFLPCMQFSVTPWQYDDEVVTIAHAMVKLHEEFSNVMIGLARESVETGEPIIKPLWWVAPDDENALTIDSQFLVGDDILVAPVLEKKATKRNIYLPAGRWRDMLHDEVIDGECWINDFPVKLSELPYFSRE